MDRREREITFFFILFMRGVDIIFDYVESLGLEHVVLHIIGDYVHTLPKRRKKST